MTEPRSSYFTVAVHPWVAVFCSPWDSDALEHFPYHLQLAYMARIGKSNWLFTDFFKFPLQFSDVKNTLNKHDWLI